jgi:hypothetical protein
MIISIEKIFFVVMFNGLANQHFDQFLMMGHIFRNSHSIPSQRLCIYPNFERYSSSVVGWKYILFQDKMQSGPLVRGPLPDLVANVAALRSLRWHDDFHFEMKQLYL